MRNIITVTFILLSVLSFGQNKRLKLENAIVVGQFDKNDERYTMEAFMTELLSDYKVKTVPSINYVKTGESIDVLLQDSLTTVFLDKGFNTYMVVGVRGYDRIFKPTNFSITMKEKLDQGTLREIYRQGAVSVTFEFSFFRNNELVRIDYFRVSNVADKDAVLKKLRKKLPKYMLANWR